MLATVDGARLPETSDYLCHRLVERIDLELGYIDEAAAREALKAIDGGETLRVSDGAVEMWGYITSSELQSDVVHPSEMCTEVRKVWCYACGQHHRVRDNVTLPQRVRWCVKVSASVTRTRVEMHFDLGGVE